MKFTLVVLLVALAAVAVFGDQHDKTDKQHMKEHPGDKHTKNDGHGHKRSVRSLGALLLPAAAHYGSYAGYGPAAVAAPPYAAGYGYGLHGLAYYG